VFVSASVLAATHETTPVPVADKSCPLTLHSARIIDAGDAALRIGYTIHNPQKKGAEVVVVAAAAVDANGKVRALQTRPVQQPVTRQSTSEYVAEFERIELAAGERLVVGIQGIVWDKRRVWQGALPLAKTSDAILVAANDRQ
jgi:hypothetical protein